VLYRSKDSIFVTKGPLSAVISVFKNEAPDLYLARLGAERAISLLEEVAKFKGVICANIRQVHIENNYPPVVKRMISATRAIGDDSLTPKAAVAGAIADEVADFVFRDEAVSKVVVNNGGDIAIRLRGEQRAKVGIRLSVLDRRVSYILEVDAKSQIGGTATSGLGGRSFTKGIASAAVAAASDASLADAASTVLGNAINVDDPSIERKLAEEIYPETDLVGHWITTKVGEISKEKVEEALRRGLAKAEELQKGLIMGALLVAKGEVRTSGIMCLSGSLSYAHFHSFLGKV